ncbi:hypothetical protein LINPERHAP2_LOCUS19542, partial [Linum perenne]
FFSLASLKSSNGALCSNILIPKTHSFPGFPSHGVDLLPQSPHKLTQGYARKRVNSGGVYVSLPERGEYHSQKPPTPLLDTINYLIHMKNLLRILALSFNHGGLLFAWLLL